MPASTLSPLYQPLLLDIHTRLMTGESSPQAILQDVAELLHERLSYSLVWFALLDDDDNLGLRAIAGAPLTHRQMVGVTLPRTHGMRGESLSFRCLRTRRPVIAQHSVAELPFATQLGSMAVVPLKSGDQVFGILGAQATCGHKFRRQELRFLEAVSTHCAFVFLMKQRFADTTQALAHTTQAAAVFDFAMEGIFITDLNGRILAANPAVCRVTGYSETELLGATPALFRSGRHDKAFYDAFWGALAAHGCWRGEIWNRRKNGEEFPELLCVSAIHGGDGQVSRYVGLLVDISMQKIIEADLAHKAHFDPLTGLANRGHFEPYLGRMLAQAQREQSILAVLFLDLDDFKYVNDSLGHDEGDRLIKVVAERLRECLRSEDMVARLGGDEFAVVLAGLAHMQDAAIVARKLLDAVSEPIALTDCEVFVTTSIGVALFPDDGATVDILLRRADSAMYGAKERGSNAVQFYRPEMSVRNVERLAVGSALKNALDRDDFFLVYQPQVEIASGRLVGVEALLRWRHEGDVITPDRFIPIAEETGMIVAIGAWALDAACAQAQRWHAQGMTDLRMSVNLSARQFRERTLLQMIRTALDQSGFAATHLEVELTESLAIGNACETAHVLAALKDMGVGIAIDDFGTGYSSLACLGRYPFDTLKIDLSFVHAIGRDSRMESLIRAIIAIADSLDLSLVAEGVETTQQLTFLRKAGCSLVQGYLTGIPMSPSAFEAHAAEALA